jgi:hypothetical protein
MLDVDVEDDHAIRVGLGQPVIGGLDGVDGVGVCLLAQAFIQAAMIITHYQKAWLRHYDAHRAARGQASEGGG